MEESMRVGEEDSSSLNQIELSVRGEKNQMEESMRVEEEGSSSLVEMTELEKEMEESMSVEEEGSSSLVEMTELEKEMEESMRVEEEGSSSLVEISELEKEMERWNKTSIYWVPAHIKLKGGLHYRPLLVSLGPFYNGDPNLWSMEGHKRRALLHLVKRAQKPMDEFVAAVKEEADRLEAAYGQHLNQKWRGDNNNKKIDDGRKRFVDMMVTDGCFLLEVMMMIEHKGEVQGYAPNDPVFSKHGYLYLKNVILADMFVMENQLPMLLLETLALLLPSEIFQDVRGMMTNMVVALFGLPPFDNSYHLGGHSLHPIDIALKVLCGESERYADASREREDTMPCFLKPFIEIARKILCGESERFADASREREDTMPCFLKPFIDIARKILCGESERYADEWRERKDTMPSALELYEAGIHFKASRSRSLLDIDFQRGVLSMPVLRVHNYVQTVFLNLMAFEQLHPGAGNGVTEYLIFMDHIIDSAKDVALLRSKGVLDCALGCDKEVAELFNTLSKGAVMDPSIKLQDVRLRVNAYCRKLLNKWRASFVHTYLRNPWVFISLVAAAVLLVATLLQTIFTIKPLR